jgi:hypothetical protein
MVKGETKGKDKDKAITTTSIRTKGTPPHFTNMDRNNTSSLNLYLFCYNMCLPYISMGNASLLLLPKLNK